MSSQSGAAGSLITSGADVAAIGGFSGRESQVTVEWLADAVEHGPHPLRAHARAPTAWATTAASAPAR